MLAALFNTDVLWRNALVAIPLALVVAGICRFLPCRPSTRHLLWLVVLGVLFVPPGVPRVKLPVVALGENTDTSGTDAPMATGTAGAEPVPSRPAPAAPAAPPTVDRPALRVSDLQRGSVPAPASSPAESRVPTAPPTPFESRLTAAAVEPVLARPGPQPAAPVLHTATAPAQRSNPAPDRHATRPTALAQLFAPVHPPTSELSVPSDGRAAFQRPLFAVPAVPNFAPAVIKPGVVTRLSTLADNLLAPLTIKATEWGGKLNTALQAVAAFPALPSNLWLGGSVGLALLAAIRWARHGRMLRTAVPAPADVLAMVADAARTLGLRRTPTTLMVQERLSPMIWCGRRARLILPAELWDELDEPGRTAVIYHELAHLKRRDHWVCWVELIASAIYWWHPLVWIVRRRLREEADLCCDAWVTMTMPRSRRAYAEALLETRRFISESKAAQPAVGLGAISGRARHFARRLTMVMTQRMTPRRSVSGMILAVTLGAAGVLSAPLLACPPEDGKDKDSKNKGPTVVRGLLAPAAPQTARAPQAPRAPRAPRAAVVPAEPPTPPVPPAQLYWRGSPGVTTLEPTDTFNRHMAERSARTRSGVAAPVPGQPGRPGAVMGGGAFTPAPGQSSQSRDLDKRLQRLEQRLDELNRRLDQMMERINRRGEAPGLLPQLLGTTPLDLAPLTAVTVGASGDGQRTVVVLVGPGDKVQAFNIDEEQVAGIRAMLSANGQAVAVERRALEEHVRALAESGRSAAAMREYGVDREALAAIEGERARALAAQGEAFAALHERLAQGQQEALAAGEIARAQELAAQALNSASVRDALIKANRERARAQAGRARDYERLAERLRERAEGVGERAETLAERLAEIEESAQSLNGKAREERLKAAEQLQKEIEKLKEAADKIREQADELSGQADELSSQADDEGEETDAEAQADEAEEMDESEEADEPEAADEPDPALVSTVPSIAVVSQAPAAGSCCSSASSCTVSTVAPVATTAPCVSAPVTAPAAIAPVSSRP